MGIVSIVLLVLFVIGCVLLVTVILLQDEHGEGLGGLLAGSSASFGPRTGNVLTRFTTVLAIVFLVGAFAVAWLNRTPEIGDVVRRARIEQAKTGDQSDWWVESSSTGTTGASGEATSSGAGASGSTTESGAASDTGSSAQGESSAPSTGGQTSGQ